MSFGSIASITTTQVEIQYTRLARAYTWAFAYTVIGSVIAVSLGVMLNKANFLGGNFVLAAIFLTAWAFLTFYPGSVAIVFGIGGLEGLPKDWSINRLIREGALPDLQISNVAEKGFTLIKKYVHLSAHLAFFVTIVFVTLGTWRLENGRVVLPVFIVLSGIGLWAVLFTKGTVWYKRVTIIILLAALIGLVYTGYTYTPPQNKVISTIDDTLMKNDDLRKERRADALHKKVRNGEVLDDKEIAELHALRSPSRAEQAVKSVSEIIPIPTSTSRPLQWQLFDRIECSVGWNDREGGPWCDSIELPNGSYHFIVERTMWKHADLGPDGTLSYFDIPPEGLSLSSFPAASHSFKREFWQGAPCGGNGRLGAVVIKTSTINCYDPFARDTTPLVIASAKPKEKVLIGTNFPLNKLYVQADMGKIIVEVERLQ